MWLQQVNTFVLEYGILEALFRDKLHLAKSFFNQFILGYNL